MAGDKKSQTVYADHQIAKTGKGYYRSKTVDLQELMDNVGRYASVTVFLNEREDTKNGGTLLSTSLIFNESEAKYLPKKQDGDSTPPPAGGAPAGGRSDVRRV